MWETLADNDVWNSFGCIIIDEYCIILIFPACIRFLCTSNIVDPIDKTTKNTKKYNCTQKYIEKKKLL